MASNSSLLAAILRDPEAAAPRLVYADWLQLQGDPRGELIVVQDALSRTRYGRDVLEQKERSICNRLQEEYAWEMRPKDETLGWPEPVVTRWRLGFPEDVTLKFEINARSWNPYMETLHGIFSRPDGPLIRGLGLAPRHWAAGGPTDWRPLLNSTVGADLSHLRRLRVLDGEPELVPADWGVPASFEPLYRAVPALEVLRVTAPMVRLGVLRLPVLRELEVQAMNISSPENLRSLMSPRWKTLEALALNARWDFLLGVESLGPLLAGKNFPSLAHLAVRGFRDGPALLGGLASGLLLRQLRTLDLSGGTLQAQGVETLNTKRASFKHLDVVVVDDPVVDHLRDRPSFQSLCRVVPVRGRNELRKREEIPK